MVQQSEILEKSKSLLEDNSIITGGHFRIFFDDKGLRENLNKGTIESFSLAVVLFIAAKNTNLNVSLGLLINDMGSSCDEDGCRLSTLNFSREDYKLPGEYMRILKSNGLNAGSVKTFWEKHVRNRGKKELLKLIKKNNTDLIRESRGIFIKDPGGYEKIILTRTQGKDKYGTPACPLIMAGLHTLQSKQYSGSINFYYTGSDNTGNIPNPYVIEKGKRVAELLGTQITVNNIFFSRF
jgi:hypothetical protein